MGIFMPGGRVDSIADMFDWAPGEYAPRKNAEGAIVALWFKLPTGTLGRIAATGYGTNDEPEWTITENSDGTVTVDPSIKQDAIESVQEPIPAWHGFLRNGIWESV